MDDEQQVLDGLVRVLRQGFDLTTVTSGPAALEILKQDPSFAIVMSDMRMPIMNGAAFLAQARQVAPDAVRLLLTGQAELEDAIAAVNEGSIFRFLKKPCAPETMRGVLAAATEQHRLVLAERELLERTLRGAVQALSETLAMTAPSVFGASTRVKQMSLAIASKLGVTVTWPLEIAAMMCQLGAIALPPGLWERRAHRALMSPVDRTMLDRVPLLTEQLLSPIPRLEPVVDIIRHALKGPHPNAVAADILRVVLDFEELADVADVRALTDRHRPEVLEALASVLGVGETGTREIPIAELREDMTIASDVVTTAGMLLVPRGHRITLTLADRIRNFGPSLRSQSVQITL